MSKIDRREFLGRIGFTAAGLLILQSGCAVRTGVKSSGSGASAGLSKNKLADGFISPPFDCGPWVYWFWLDVNVTREGITADLEAMKAVGIAGVLIMDVDQGTPASFNGAKFGDAKWYELFQFACEEANRLGMQVNMTNDAGWCGSGGPWVTPELSMQVVVWSSTKITGGKSIENALPQPRAAMNFYRDIGVLAIPAAPKSGAKRSVARARIVDLTGKMDVQGMLRCELPEGEWTILRFGHTTTGVQNHPAPDGGLGLETDKLSRAATLFQFESLMGRIIKMVGPLAGETLVATHIDSWETGVQNWTPTMRDDFKRLRGYDLFLYLPVLAGEVVDSAEVSQRFLWDLQKTVGDLLIENYAVAMREMARKHGMRLSIEGYSGEPASDVWYGGEADEPMSECWSWGRYGANETVTEMVSAGHVYGRNIIGQETFTADSGEKWLGHPAVVKDIGDWTFSEGVNRFVFHRYAMQPWTDPHYAPGVSMGPWGLHYERTQTWWKMSKTWHEYVARCCYMLRQGHFVADVCYMELEGAPRGFGRPDDGMGHPPRRPGYNYDGCPPELVLERMEFEDGFLTLPGGMKYRVLVLPEWRTMTAALLRKIKSLVDAGAMVIGPKPEASPSLMEYPHCDNEVKKIATELWDSGKIISGKSAAEVLAARGIKPDFECDQPMVRWAHRHVDDMDIYFVANGAVDGEYPYAGRPMVANCSFRMADTRPEIWNPESGTISPVALYDTTDGITRIPIVLGPVQSVFVVFRHAQSSRQTEAVRSLSRDDKAILVAGGERSRPRVEILSARYGKFDEPEHTRDVKEIIQKLADKGETSFPVVEIAAIGGDPDLNVVKTLDVHCRVDGKEKHILLHDGDFVDFGDSGEDAPATLDINRDGNIEICARKPGNYHCVLATGKTAAIAISNIAEPMKIEGPWTVSFPSGWGAPEQIQLEKLIAWDKHDDAGLRYFSGTANYQCSFHIPAKMLAPEHRIELDLGRVAVMADVTLNGQHLGVLWKTPFRLNVNSALRAGRNKLEIAVANLWVNRLIGDQQLPADAERAPDGHLLIWPQWLLEGKPSPTGRFTFTTWELWRKTDPLVESGLIGPVRLLTSVRKRMSSAINLK
ncbi:MAG TPA: glycosyl hydrolase [Tepidisphaeraceae bacterium]|jgi:hypothetical protein